MEPETIRERLKSATQALALPYEEQVKIFPDFVLITDELVIEFDESYRNLNLLIENGLIAKEDAVVFEEIDAYSQYLSDNFTDMFLEPSSLKSDSKWEKMRDLAKLALKKMNWKLEPPDFSQNVYISQDRVE